MARRSALPAEPVTVAIDTLSHEGRGVGRVNGKTVFVDYALPGEQVRARYTRRHGRYDEAVALEILQPSPQRVQPGCAHFGVCGGCSLQHLSPAAQLAHKQQVLLEQLEHIGGIRPRTVLPPIEGPAWGYRRRARLGVRRVPKKGGVLIGFREKHSRYVADIQSCPVLHPAIGEKLGALRAAIDALSCRDQIPQIETGMDGRGPIFTLRHLAPLTDADRAQLQAAASSQGWRFYLQPGGMDTVTPLRDDGAPLYFEIPGHDVRLYFEPLDFMQVNSAVNLAAIDRVIELLDARPADVVLDLFCGLGNFTLPLARQVGRITGVEGDAGLVTRARQNAERNGIGNASFVQADLTRAGPPAEACNKLLLDPPRTGALEILRQLQLKDVTRVVYVSCNPATLARDAGILTGEHGFILESAGVMDMFPHTAHVESVALFLRL